MNHNKQDDSLYELPNILQILSALSKNAADGTIDEVMSPTDTTKKWHKATF